jgi:hypothetical protein
MKEETLAFKLKDVFLLFEIKCSWSMASLFLQYSKANGLGEI